MELIPGLNDDVGLQCLTRVPFDSFPSVASVCRAWSFQIQHPHFHRIRKLSGLARPVFVLSQAHPGPPPDPLSGSSEKSCAMPVQTYWLTVFEPVSGSWTRLPPEPGLPGGLPMFCGLVGVGSDLIVMGGWDPITWQVSKAVHIFDFLTGQWRRGADMPGPARSLFGIAGEPTRRTVMIAGGHSEDKTALKSAFLYDVAKDVWAPLPDMAKERDECSVAFQAGRFHVIGGYETDKQGRFGSSAETLDPSTWQWGPTNDSYLEEGASWAIGNGEGEVYTCQNGQVSVRQDDNKWQAIAEMPDQPRSMQRVMMWRNEMVTFQRPGNGELQNVAYMLDLKSRKWSQVDLPLEYSGHVQLGCGMEL